MIHSAPQKDVAEARRGQPPHRTFALLFASLRYSFVSIGSAVFLPPFSSIALDEFKIRDHTDYGFRTNNPFI